MDLGSSTELITLKPWSTGKQLPLGFSVLDQSDKRQAASLTVTEGYYRMYLEGDNYGQQNIKKNRQSIRRTNRSGEGRHET
jgi:hypothetical protein